MMPRQWQIRFRDGEVLRRYDNLNAARAGLNELTTQPYHFDKLDLIEVTETLISTKVHKETEEQPA